MNELTKQIKLEDKGRDFNWINSIYTEGKLYDQHNERQFTERTFNQLRTVIRTVQQIYEDQWDLEIEIIQDTDGEIDEVLVKGIVIRIGDITITNGSRSRPIKDLFVMIQLGQNREEYVDDETGDLEYRSKLYIVQLEGGRMHLDYAEYCSGYFHSHLPSKGGLGSFLSRSGPAPYYSRFCTGSGHINDYLAELNSEGISEETLTPYLVQIIGLVTWESLDGGPHIRMSSVKISSNNGVVCNPTSTQSLSLYNNIISKYRETGEPIPLTVKLESSNYSLEDNDNFNQFLEYYNLSDTEKQTYLCTQSTDGNYYRYGDPPGYPEIVPHDQISYIFQGQEIPFTIEDCPNREDTIGLEYSLHPKIKNYIKQEIEYELNNKKIRQSTINRYSNQGSNA